jgi:hypothetical protein
MFTPIRHQLIFPPSVSRMLSSTFRCFLVFQASSSFLELTQPSGTVWFDQIHSSVFCGFLRLSSSPSLLFQVSSTFFDLPRPSMTFGFAQFVSFLFFHRPSVSFLTSTVFDRPGNPFPNADPSALFHWLLYSSDSRLDCSDCFLHCPVPCAPF